MIPTYSRYVEPFFGGGALFFHLCPKVAIINDISSSLMDYYSLIKYQDQQLHDLLLCYSNSFTNTISVCEHYYPDLINIFSLLLEDKIDTDSMHKMLDQFVSYVSDKINSGFNEKLLLDEKEFIVTIKKMAANKIVRTVNNHKKRPFSHEDLKTNLITGFASGYYIYFRKVFNDLNLSRVTDQSRQYKAANFYFIREYCYGSMFRYNSKGEFNIPYGGMTYNKKNLKNKIDNMFNSDIKQLFKNTEICCSDFELFLSKSRLTINDFVFLDPPYDTDFSNYEGRDFSKFDQERLAYVLQRTPAQFILVIKNTDFIHDLYQRKFNILSFDNKYSYNVRSRNERVVEHLIVTNLPI